MSVPRSVSDILTKHVTLELEGIDRLYLNVIVRDLQDVGGVVRFLRKHRGHPIASTAMVTPMSAAFVSAGRAADRLHVDADRRLQALLHDHGDAGDAARARRRAERVHAGMVAAAKDE